MTVETIKYQMRNIDNYNIDNFDDHSYLCVII